MINSDDVEIQEVADAIQSKLFYEVSNIELVVSLCKDNKTHMVAYMVSLVESIHQLMKLLENYSKSKDILFTRKKKKEKKPKEKDGAVSDEEDDEPESHKAKYVERQFRFSTIESVRYHGLLAV